MKTETPLHADIDTNQWFFNYDNSTPNSGGGGGGGGWPPQRILNLILRFMWN